MKSKKCKICRMPSTKKEKTRNKRNKRNEKQPGLSFGIMRRKRRSDCRTRRSRNWMLRSYRKTTSRSWTRRNNRELMNGLLEKPRFKMPWAGWLTPSSRRTKMLKGISKDNCSGKQKRKTKKPRTRISAGKMLSREETLKSKRCWTNN